MIDTAQDSPETAFARCGLGAVHANLRSLLDGDAFLPVQVIRNGGEGVRAHVVELLRNFARANGCACVRLAASPGAFPTPAPEEQLVEKILGSAPDGGAAARRIAARLRAPHSPPHLERDQAAFIHTRTRLQQGELCFRLLVALHRETPLLAIVEAGGDAAPPLADIVRAVARSTHARLHALRRQENWPRVCFHFVCNGGTTAPAFFADEPFAGHAAVTAAEAPAAPAPLPSLSPADVAPLRFLAAAEQPLPVSIWRATVRATRATFNRLAVRLQRLGVIELFGPRTERKAELATTTLQAALLAEVSPDERRELDLRLAEAECKVPAYAPRAAFHFLAAGDTTRGLALAVKAAERARRDGSPEHALAFLRSLVEGYGASIAPPVLARLRGDLADLYTLAGDHARAERHLREVAAFHVSENRAIEAAEASIDIALLRANQGMRDQALALIDETACTLADKPKGRPAYLRLLLARARIQMEKGELAAARDSALAARAFFDAHAERSALWRRLEALTSTRMGNIAAALSDFDGATDAYENAYRILAPLPDSLEKGALCCNLANLFTNRGMYKEAGKWYARTARVAAQIGAKELRALVEANLGVLAMCLWDLEAAEKHIRTGLALADEVGSERFTKFARLCLATLHCRQGNLRESTRIFGEERERARRAGDRYMLMNACFQSVYPYMELGDWHEARRAAAEGAELAAEIAAPRGKLEGALELGQIAARLGLWDEAAARDAEARAATWHHHGQIGVELDDLEGQIALGRGDAHAALEAFAAARDGFAKLKVPRWASRAEVDFAAALFAAGRTRRARRVLDRVWQEISARPPARRAPVAWLLAATLRGERIVAENPEALEPWRKVSYELAEALARARELSMTPYLWRILDLQRTVCERLGDPRRASEYANEAAAELRAYRRRLPADARRAFDARQDVRAILGDAEPPADDGATRNVAAAEQSAGAAASGGAGEAWCGMIGVSTAMREVFALIEKIAPSDVPVLITGESGTGKELVARAIHRLSTRATAPLEAENCAAIPEALAESELFGYERGAFSGATCARPGRVRAASGGTLFLDEIGDLPREIQAKLLRVLAESAVRPLGGASVQKVDFRLLSATGRDLRSEVERGGFRPDLFYRILGVEIRLPPLRQRPEDIIALAEHFLRTFCAERGTAAHLTTRAQQALVDYEWPGNVRELQNEIHRLALLGGERIDARDLRIRAGPRQSDLLAAGVVRRHTLTEAHALLEREYLLQALDECGGVIARVAKLLGVHRRSVYKIMRRAGLDPDRLRGTADEETR